MPLCSIIEKKTKQGESESQAAVYVSLCLFFAAVSVFAIFETDFTVLSQRDFGWGAGVCLLSFFLCFIFIFSIFLFSILPLLFGLIPKKKNSIYFLVAALISTVMYFIIGGIPKLKKANERKGTAVGYLLLVSPGRH